jgi:hypothetical protein
MKAEARLAEAERDMDQLIGERDHAQGMADKLADAIATLLGVEIGEHSNMNCPWTQALEAFEDRPTASTSGPKCERCSDTGWIQGDPVFGISDEPCGCAEAVDALAARLDAADALLREAREEVEWWTPCESTAAIEERPRLNRWFAKRDRIDAYLAREP